jgi:hypothetical protein
MRPVVGVVFLIAALIAIVLSIIAYGNMSTLLDPENANLSMDDYPVFQLYAGDLLAAADEGNIDVAKLASQLQRRIATVGLASILMIAIAVLLIFPGSGKPSVDEHDLERT